MRTYAQKLRPRYGIHRIRTCISSVYTHVYPPRTAIVHPVTVQAIPPAHRYILSVKYAHAFWKTGSLPIAVHLCMYSAYVLYAPLLQFAPIGAHQHIYINYTLYPGP